MTPDRSLPHTSPLNIGVIGCGYWGPNLVRNFNALNGAQVVRVADLDDERRTHIQDLYPTIEGTQDANEIIGDAAIDAVAVATPVSTHHSIARKALLSGKHVFVEKPICETSAQVEELIQIASERGLTLFVGHTFVYSLAVHKIRDIVASGALGDLFYISARRLNLGLLQREINVVQDLAPHDLSILNFVLDQEPVAVSASGKAHYQPEIEDVAILTLEYPGNLVVYLHFSWLDPKKTREMVFVGSEKMLVYDDVEAQEKIRLHDKRVVAPSHYDTFGEFMFSYHYGDIHIPWIRGGEPLRAECQHFLDCVRTGAAPHSGGPEGLRVVRVIEAALQSMRSEGTRVELATLSPVLDAVQG
jgi:predicted dehydrogenase